MLDLRVTIEGNTALIDGLDRFASQGIDQAVQRGLSRAGAGVFREAFAWLSGPGAKMATTGTAIKEGGKWKIKGRKDTEQDIAAGGYPVPVRTGYLRHMLDFVPPGDTKTGSGLTVTAGLLETIIYNAAEYAETIFQAKGSSSKFRKRDALTDGLEKFNQGSQIKLILEEELAKELKK